MYTSLFVALPSLLCCEHKELVERRWRIEERAEIYLNINSECGGTSGMKDVEPHIIVHDQGVLFQRFAAV